MTCTVPELVGYSLNGAIIGFLFYNLVSIGAPTLVSILFLFIVLKVLAVGKKKL